MLRNKGFYSRAKGGTADKGDAEYTSSGDEGYNSHPATIQNINKSSDNARNIRVHLKRSLMKMQQFATSKPSLLEDLLKDRITCTEFAAQVEHLSKHSRQSFVGEWAKLLKRLHNHVNYSSSMSDIDYQTDLAPSNAHPMIPVINHPVEEDSRNTGRSTTIQMRAYGSNSKLQKSSSNHQMSASSKNTHLLVSPRQIGPNQPFKPTSPSHPKSVGSQGIRRTLSRERYSNGIGSTNLNGNVALPALKSNTAEAVAALAPYISRYATHSTPTTDMLSPHPSVSRNPILLDVPKSDTLPKDLPHGQLHLLRAITALAYTSEGGGTSHAAEASPPRRSGHLSNRGSAIQSVSGSHGHTPHGVANTQEGTSEILRLLQSDELVTPERMVRIWGYLSGAQQAKWVHSVVQQLFRLHNALSLFRRVTEETNYKRAVNVILSAVAETVSATLVSFYDVRPHVHHNLTNTDPSSIQVTMGTTAPNGISLQSAARELRIEASTGPFDPSKWMLAGYGISGRVAQDSQMLHVENASSDSRYASNIDGEVPINTSILSIPLRMPSSQSASHFSILQICAASFTSEDILLLESIAGHLAVILGTVQSRGREIKMRKKLQALVQISHTITAELDLSVLIGLMRQKSKELLDADKCTLFLVLPGQNVLWTRIEEGNEITFPMSSGIAGYVATTGHTVNIPDAYKDPRFRPDVDIDTGYRTKTILCMPVKDGSGKVIGAIQMINKANGTFDEEDEELLTAFCAHAAVVISNSKAYQKELIERKKFQALSQIMDVISSETELEPLIDILRQKSKELLDSDKCTLFLLDQDTKELHTKLAEGMNVHFPVSQGIAGYVVSTGETLNIPDAYADHRFNKDVDIETGYKTNNILCMPVRNDVDGTIVGAIQMVNKRGQPFGVVDEEILKAFSAHAAVTITKTRLYSEVMESNKTLENILKSIASFVVTFNMSGLFQSSNRPIDALFGVTEGVMRTTPFWNWMGAYGNDQLIRDLKAVIATPKPVRVNSYVLYTSKEDTRIVNYIITPLVNETVESPTSLWKKRQKTGVLLVLDDINDISTMRKTIYDMESRMGEFRTQVNSILEAPIHAVIQTMERLSHGELTTDVARKELLRCIRMLGSSDVFRPDLPKMLEGVDPETRSMIMLEYTRDSSYDNLHIVDSWPDIEHVTRLNSIAELTWDFDALSHSEDHLLSLIFTIFEHFNFIELFHISVEKLRSFILAIRAHYRKNPFHNFFHAFTVTQITYLILVKTDVVQYLSNLDILALLIAALCHDLEHPGVNNGFEIGSHSSLALLYNDVSVQESHHCSVGFSLMRKQENAILTGLTVDEYKELRKSVVTAILATDMAQHFEITGKFKSAISSKKFSRDNREDRLHLVAIILHAADLSNPIRPPAISEKWARMLRDEFTNQTKREKEVGIPVTPFMVIEDDFTLAKNEVGFIDFVVRPLWEALANFLPDLKCCIDNMDANKKAWQELMANSARK